MLFFSAAYGNRLPCASMPAHSSGYALMQRHFQPGFQFPTLGTAGWKLETSLYHPLMLSTLHRRVIQSW